MNAQINNLAYLYKAGSIVITFTLNFNISCRRASENAMQALLDME